MDVYLTSLAIGGMGLVAMAFSGSGRHGQGHGHGHAGAHGSSHGGAHGPGHAAGHGPIHDVGGAGHGHAGAGHGGSTHGPPGHGPTAHGSHGGASHVLLSLMSPRVLFSVCLGLGTTGLLLQHNLGGVPLFAAAVAGGVLFERFVVTPIWNLAFRFASAPALTLESALMSEATAVTRFDGNGQGIIAIEVDGHVVQLLGTLQPTAGVERSRVLAGTRLRIEDVDAARNRCTVSLI